MDKPDKTNKIMNLLHNLNHSGKEITDYCSLNWGFREENMVIKKKEKIHKNKRSYLDQTAYPGNFLVLYSTPFIKFVFLFLFFQNFFLMQHISLLKTSVK